MADEVLIIDDDARLAAMLGDYLGSNGYSTARAGTGRAGVEEVRRRAPDAVILDVMLPDIDGFEACRQIRAFSDVPVLMLTAKGDETDRIVGLELGADDYLPKPFSRDELLARVRALLRRNDAAPPAPSRLALGDVIVDLGARRALRNNQELPLSAREFAMLALLIERAGQVVTREDFLDRVWGVTAFPTTRTVDKHIVSLRQKIEVDPAQPRWIHTVHGTGYRLELPPPP